MNQFPKNKYEKIFAIFFALILFLLMAKNADAATLSKAPNNLGLVGYWSFNEGTSTVALDYSGNKNKGTLVNGPTWVNGKQGKALNFDGGNDYVDAKSPASLNLTTFTLSVWWNGASHVMWGGPVSNRIAGQNGFQFVDDQNGLSLFRPHLVIWNGISETAQYKGATTYNVPFNSWKHFVWTYDGSTARLFVNGVKETVTTSGISNYPINGIWIGRSYAYVGGLIDEVRIYNRALSAGEIQTLYNVGAVKYTPPNNLGLVGYWSFNEGTSTVALDYSGNKNKGTLVNGPTWVNGKQGKALNFDGGNDRVVIGDPANNSLDFGSGSFSYGMWVNPASFIGNYDMPWFKGGSSAGAPGYDFELGSGAWTVNIADATTIKSNSFLSSGTLGTWTHIFAVVDRSTNRLVVYVNGKSTGVGTDISTLGSMSGTYSATISSNGASYPFNGLIDEVRIYNRALSAGEIQTLYNVGAVKYTPPNNLGLVGYWSFNEGTSTVALDYSGNKNKGTLTGGSTWVNGKQGKALNFDGGNDYVDMGDPASGILDFGTGDFTVSVWAKSSNYLTGRGIVSKGLYWTSPGPGYTITHISNPLRVYFNTYDGTTQAYISSGIGPTYDWTHFVGVRRGANIEFWVNGSRVGTAVAPTGSLSNTSNLTIGSGPNGKWSGTADEVRIYNRALTAGEIMKLYNTGR